MRRISLPGAFLLGLSTFQAEFDFGVPQFQLIFQPLLIMLAAGVALVAARIWLGPGAALGAALFFLAMRGLMALLVGPVLGEPTPHFPLYIVEAALVELIALRVKRPLPLRARRRRGDRHRRASPPSGPGPTSGCRCRGPPRWRRKACCSAWRWRWRRAGRRLAGRAAGRRQAPVAALRRRPRRRRDLRPHRLRAAQHRGERRARGGHPAGRTAWSCASIRRTTRAG